MTRRIKTVFHRSIKLGTLFVASFILAGIAAVVPGNVNPVSPKALAACITTAPPTTYGQVTQTVNVTTAGTYRVWSRIKAPDTTANSYYFEVDSGCAYNVGDSTSIPANTWTWVNYQDGSAAAPIDVALTAGSHTLTYTGKEANVQLDKVLLLTDTACIPTSLGDNCATVDATSPTVSVTAPTSGSTVSGTVNITANATDASGVTKVEFLVDGALKGTDTTSAYAYAWDSTTATNGTHSITAKAYDATGNVGTSTAISVTVNNAPVNVTIPYRMNAGGPAFTDPTSTAWGADAHITGGNVVDRGAIAIANTTNDQLYQTEHYDLTAINIPVANGTYQYRLHFAETYSGCTVVGCRVQNITVEGAAAITGLDIVRDAPGSNTALIRTGTITVADGNATFGFAATAGGTLINGVELLTAPAPDTTAPTTSITAPAGGTSYQIGSTVTITASASDNVGVTKVEFLVDNVLKNTDTTSPYSYPWSTTGVTAGAHALTVKAYDAAGNVKTSTAVSVTLTTPNIPGDCTGDGRVNALDLSSLITHDGDNFTACDFNNDGTVGSADMAILIPNWTW